MKHTLKTKKKMSLMRMGEKNPFFGKKHTKKTRAKLAANLRRYSANRKYSIVPQTIIIPKGLALAYFAAMVDGEGSVGFSKGTPYVAIYNSNLDLMRWLKRKTGKSFRLSDLRGRVKGYCWRIGAMNDIRALCEALLPHLIIKLKNAKKVLAFIEEKHGKNHTN